MDVVINEMHSTVDAIDGDALLSRETLERIVRAVMRAMEDGQRRQEMLRRDLDTRSIVDQQRDGAVGDA